MSSSPEYAGFWQRALAFLIDWLIVVVISVPVIVLVFGANYFSLEPATRAWDLVTALIVDARTGGAPGTGRLVLRFLCYFLSAAPLYLGFFWIAIDRRKQGWHDKIAGTVVIQAPD